MTTNFSDAIPYDGTWICLDELYRVSRTDPAARKILHELRVLISAGKLDPLDLTNLVAFAEQHGYCNGK